MFKTSHLNCYLNAKEGILCIIDLVTIIHSSCSFTQAEVILVEVLRHGIDL